MTASTLPNDWREALGITRWKAPAFFASKSDIDAAGDSVPQAHALRRAFDRLGLDGILCLQNNPVAYFKEVAKIDRQKVAELHRQFWNQGLAPILILIDDRNVHVYSGLARPATNATALDADHRLVHRLNRVADEAELRQIVLSIESGEYFRAHAKSFDPKQRVDRELLRSLQAARTALAEASTRSLSPTVLDALLCRIVFVCYLFDRNAIGQSYLESIGIKNAGHLRDILKGPKQQAKGRLYALFKQLGADFNGDLFSDDLDAEARQVTSRHLEIFEQFLNGTNVATGQGSFWPYNFDMIPIETISAIYEHFLKAEDAEAKRQAGAFYTPRFLAEVTLDIALEGVGNLHEGRFLDPACGSGIFLVGIFNRLAEHWKRANPGARYDRRANALISILRNNICGADINPTACRIAAFSLYLAFLDQLSPPDIQELQRKGKLLPRLVRAAVVGGDTDTAGRTIHCGDFFATDLSSDFDVIIGNPPWKSLEGTPAEAERWCARNKRPIANRQLAIGFIWKAAAHLRDGGRICFVLPHGILFNHQDKAVEFQRAWLEQQAVDVVLNLADMRFNLFEAAVAPSLIVRYRSTRPDARSHRIKYLVPKTSWATSQAELVSIVPEDRTEFPLANALSDLRAGRTARVWKERYWGTPRDWKLLDRLADMPPLGSIVGQQRSGGKSRWLIAEGVQPVGESDDLAAAKRLSLPSRHFISARAVAKTFLLSREDCETLPKAEFLVRSGSNTNTDVFNGPHVLATKGLNVAFADFAVSFRHAVRGIHGPKPDRDLLVFLAVYLRSPIARYYLFHTSSRWGIERSEVEVAELLRVPFPLPEHTAAPKQAKKLLSEIVMKLDTFAGRKRPWLADMEAELRQIQEECDAALYEYFDIHDVERALIEDTISIAMESILPTRASSTLPTLKESSPAIRRQYLALLCETLNDWAKGSAYRVSAHVSASPKSGVAAVILQRSKDAPKTRAVAEENQNLMPVLDRLQKAFKTELGSVELLRGVKVFDKDTLYLFKPLGQRFWTRTAALNDADEIATTVLLSSRKEQK